MCVIVCDVSGGEVFTHSTVDLSHMTNRSICTGVPEMRRVIYVLYHLFYRALLQKRPSNLKEPTNRSHPIHEMR